MLCFPPSHTISEVSWKVLGNEEQLCPSCQLPWDSSVRAQETPKHPGAQVWGMHLRRFPADYKRWWRWRRRNIRNDCRKQIALSFLASHNNNSYLGHIWHFTSGSSWLADTTGTNFSVADTDSSCSLCRDQPWLVFFPPTSSLQDVVISRLYHFKEFDLPLCHPAATHWSKGNGFTLRWKRNQFRDLNIQRK